MLIKYCIEQLIKNWNLYLNQILFAIRIRTHITIDFFFFYLLYEINFTFFDDIEKFSFELYDERIDSTSFLNKNRAKTFKKTMQRAKKNKIAWNAKIKKNAFSFENMILIRIKKFKKFEMNWYDFYEMIRNEILNIYVFKFSKNSSNKYFINDNRMKLTYVKKEIFKNWRMFYDRERFLKTKTSIEKNNKSIKNMIIKRKREKSRKSRDFNEDFDTNFLLSLNDELNENSNEII